MDSPFLKISVTLLFDQEDGAFGALRSFEYNVAKIWCVHGSFFKMPYVIPSGPGDELELLDRIMFLMSFGVKGFKLKG